MKNLDIFICTHKDFDNYPTDKTYKICCGENDLKNEYPIDVVYEKENKYTPMRYSLSGISRMYHIWKEYTFNKYVGFVQYDRYFDYDIINEDLQLDDNTCIVPQAWNLNVVIQYNNAHKIKDYLLVRELIKYMYGISENDIRYTENKLYAHNIFIMSSKKFNDYCNFMFTVLDKFIDINDFKSMDDINKKYDEKQNRVLGFLCERIGNIFIQLNFKNIIERPIKNNYNIH